MAAVLLSILIIVSLTLAFVQTEWGQNWLARQVTARLSRDLQSRISIDNVQIGFFNKLNLRGVFIEDQKKDTLLAAGVVQVRITDWFFLADKAVLHYIGLEDAIINLNRTDSIWNYRFLQDYFDPPGPKQPKKAGIEFNLKEVRLVNVAFNMKDGWRGQDMITRVGALSLDANNISATEKIIDINRLNLEQPYFQLYTYDGNRPTAPAAVKGDMATAWNPQNWTILAKNIRLQEGVFQNDRETERAILTYFDPQHIRFEKIGGTINNLKVASDTLRADIALATRERSGFEVKSLQARFRMHPQAMEFGNLTLKTGRSTLGNYFAMKYNSLDDLNDFIHSVNMEGRFRNSSIASDDIAFFAPQVKSWNRSVQISGLVKGTVDALTGENVALQLGQNTALSGNFNLVGLPDINTTFIHVTADDLHTTYADAVTFIPTLRGTTMPNLAALGRVRFNGSFTGFINDFVTYGTLQTSLGTLVTDLNMKFPEGGEPVYSGEITTDNFQLGRFMNNSQLGAVAFSGEVKGRSFDWQKLDMDINGNIKKLEFNDYTYQNITAKGKVKNRQFNGDFAIDDPNAVMNGTGLIDLSGTTPAFNVVAHVEKLNLQALKLTKEAISLAGDFNLNFNGNNITNFLGDAAFSSVTIMHGDKPLTFDSLVISSAYLNGVRTLSARSTQFNAHITGKFDLEALPDAVTLFLNRYYPSYIKPPRRSVANQSFTFDITTGVVEDYVKLLDSRLSGFNNSHITGSLDVFSNSLQLNAQIPQASFQQYDFSDMVLTGDGNFDRLIVTGQINNAIVSDSLSFPETAFRIEARNDTSDVAINTSANQTLNNAQLSAQIRTFADGFSVFFNPSSFVINGKTWALEEGGELDFRRRTVVQGQLVLRESAQEIRLSTQPSSIGDWNDLHVSLNNINIGDFSPFFLKQNRIEGLLYGDIVVEDPQNKLNIFAENLRTEQLRVDNDSIGQVQAAMAYNNTTGMVIGKGGNLDPQHKVRFDLALDLKDTANVYEDRISVVADNFQVAVLERFLGTLFTDMQGFVTGNLDIVGEGANRQYLAKARLHNVGLKVVFTQVYYRLDDAEIELTSDGVDLGSIKLRDRENNTATVRGTIRHKNWQNMYYDIVVETDRRPMELLNTTYNDNQQFYGRAKGTGSFILVGPQHDMFMQIIAKASEEDSSYITLPPARSRETGAASFMVERKYGREMTREEFRGSETNITYEVDITANPMATVEVILDELTGDVIRGRGVGNLKLRAGTSEPLSIRGRYDIQEGNYLFTFESFIKKPFTLRRGANNYIEWIGDPYAATINLEAIYEATNVSFAPLVSSLALSNNLSRYRSDVNVLARLTGELFRPDISFNLEFPQNFDRTIDQTASFSLEQGIRQIENNPNELNKQVAYLIVLNQFAPYETGQSGAYSALNEFAYNTISGILFNQINKQLNQLLSKILRNNDLTINFTGSLYNRNLINTSSRGFSINQSDLNISVSGPLFSERILLTLGGTFDVPLESDLQQKINLFPDVTIEFLINKTGTVRATFFYRHTPDLITTSSSGINRAQSTGANLAYRKDFNSLSRFFFGKEHGKRKKKGGQPKDSTTTTTPKDSAVLQKEQEP